nr:integrase, catalytic region, zinc finger, CCHC-type, peptidase aspartic, catalytic [Tanacetum cinerariifolium]
MHYVTMDSVKLKVLAPRVNSCTDASGSQPRSNTKKNRILPAKRVNKKKVEAHLRTNKSSLKTTNRVDYSISSKCTGVQIILWYLDSGCSKHITGDCSWLRSFVKKFMGTVRFGNDHFGAIMGYGYYVIGDSVISGVYYMEGLEHNIFSVRQFNNSDLEVASKKYSCCVRDTYGVELIKVNIDNPNITMEEYIRLEEEKARTNDKVYNWETATYCKILYNEDVHDLRSVETEFPAIVFDDVFTYDVTPFYEPTASLLNNNKIDFRISFDEFDDEDYTVIYDENSFSYKIIYVNNLKTDSENDDDIVNMPLFPSPNHEVNYSNDLDFFKDFEKKFPAIVYNDALTSKSDSLTEPTLCPQHIDEFNLKDERLLGNIYLMIQKNKRMKQKGLNSTL